MHFTKSLIAFAACFLPLIAGAPTEQQVPKLRNSGTTNTLPNSYLVVYKKEVDDLTFESEMSSVSAFLSKRDSTFKGVGHKYKMQDFKGYQIEADTETVNKISESPQVDYIEKDGKVGAFDLSVRIPAVWGLDRISHRERAANDLLHEYTYDSSAGEGTTVYVIDSGINIEHVEFEGRAVWGANFVSDSIDDDENGHGTHCAGTVGGASYGVASKAALVAVKVLDANGDGFFSDIIAGMQWAADTAEGQGQIGTSVISVSLGGNYSAAANAATSAIIGRGITVVIAAGNSDINALEVSPASTPEAITVGATDKDDDRAYFSNWGPVLDIFAPGVNITSAWIGSPLAAKTISGTSMACPHVAGLAAYFIGLNGPTLPDDLVDKITSVGTENLVTDLKGSVNLLAYNNDGY